LSPPTGCSGFSRYSVSLADSTNAAAESGSDARPLPFHVGVPSPLRTTASSCVRPSSQTLRSEDAWHDRAGERRTLPLSTDDASAVLGPWLTGLHGPPPRAALHIPCFAVDRRARSFLILPRRREVAPPVAPFGPERESTLAGRRVRVGHIPFRHGEGVRPLTAFRAKPPNLEDALIVRPVAPGGRAVDDPGPRGGPRDRCSAPGAGLLGLPQATSAVGRGGTCPALRRPGPRHPAHVCPT
jgi:hypothetical protein